MGSVDGGWPQSGVENGLDNPHLLNLAQYLVIIVLFLIAGYAVRPGRKPFLYTSLLHVIFPEYNLRRFLRNLFYTTRNCGVL